VGQISVRAEEGGREGREGRVSLVSAFGRALGSGNKKVGQISVRRREGGERQAHTHTHVPSGM
jgi:hypothetical protein